MRTYVKTTTPGESHTISRFNSHMTPFQIMDEYDKFYDDIFSYYDEPSRTWYLKCIKKDSDDQIYRIVYTS